MKRLACLIIALTASCGVSLAEEKPGIPDDVIEALTPLVGEWKSVGTTGDFESKGTNKIRWMKDAEGNKVCIAGQYSYTTEEGTRSGIFFIGWDAESKCLAERSFASEGGKASVDWKMKTLKHWVGESVRYEGGETEKSEVHLLIKSPSEIVLEGVTEDGVGSRTVFTKQTEE